MGFVHGFSRCWVRGDLSAAIDVVPSNSLGRSVHDDAHAITGGSRVDSLWLNILATGHSIIDDERNGNRSRIKTGCVLPGTSEINQHKIAFADQKAESFRIYRLSLD